MIFIVLIMLLLYAPIIFLVINSFNEGWVYYEELLTNAYYLEAIGNTLLIAFIAAVCATVIATMAATGITYMKTKSKALTMTINQLPVVNADIVTSFSLVLLFVAIGLNNFGMLKLIIAHTLIALPFCLLTILPKMRQLDTNLIDAALDLGASPFKAFTSVIVPQLVPAMIQAALLGFTLSLDDFVVTQYNNSGIPTISTVVYGAISRRDIPHAFKALTAIILVVILLVLLVMNFNHHCQRRGSKLGQRLIAIIVCAVMLLSAIGAVPVLINNMTPRSSVLKIYNCEDYIEMDLLDEFTDYYRELTGDDKFRVEYHTFTDNEELYTKIKSQKADYDLAVPSEYMVEKMRDGGLLQTININEDALPNYQNLDTNILQRMQPFATVDGATDQVWSIPYMVGTMGIMYDTDTIDLMSDQTGIDVEAFEALLDEYGFGVLFGEGGTTAFNGHITMKKSARDTIGIAMIYSQRALRDQYLDANDPENTLLHQILNMQGAFTLSFAEQALNDQINQMNPVYENDNGKKSFVNPNDHQFAYGLYWSCDAGLVMDENEAIKYYVPVGTNLWTDNFVMPIYGQNPDAAHAFINFMLDPENAKANIDYVGSEMAVTQAIDELRAEWAADEVDENYLDTVFPSDLAVQYAAVMRNFDATQEAHVNDLMISIMNRAAYLNENEDNTDIDWFLIFLGVLLVGTLGYVVIYRLTHRRRAN